MSSPGRICGVTASRLNSKRVPFFGRFAIRDVLGPVLAAGEPSRQSSPKIEALLIKFCIPCRVKEC